VNRPILMQTVPRGLVVAVMIVFVATKAPYIKDVNITYIHRHGGVWNVEGTITIDPTEVPPELQYNYDEPGFLSWWEEHINDVLAEHGVNSVHVRNLELTWVDNGNDLDVIGFCAELVFGHAKCGIHS
jgi:hypothetical protein